MILGWNTWANPDTEATRFMQATGVSVKFWE